MTVTLHYIESTNDWPPPIREFAQSICTPLSPTLIPHVGTVANFQEFAAAVDSAPTSQRERDLLRLSNIVSWTVHDLQHLSHYKALDNGPHSTLLPIYNLLKAIAHVLDPTLKVATDVPFLTPRGSHSPEGVAFAVVSHHVVKDDCPRAQVDDSPTQSNELSGFKAVCMEREDMDEEEEAMVNRWDLDTEAREAYDASHPMCDPACGAQPPTRHYEIYGPFSHIYDSEDDDTNSETESSIDLPPEAYVEAISGRRTYTTLPVVFAANGRNIFSLSSSILYQRQVWGIGLPVVGVRVSSDSSVVRLCLSWLDTNSSSEAGLPRIHTAVAAEGAESTSLGVFDLGSVLGALSFTQAMLELKNQCHIIATASKNNQTTSFRWHSGNFSIAEPLYEERVSRWLLDVDVQTRGSKDAIIPEHPSLLVGDDDKTSREAKLAPRPISSIFSQRSSSYHASNMVVYPTDESHASVLAIQPDSRSGSPFVKAVQSAPSHSVLADQTDDSIVDETMAAFLFDRDVCFVSTNSFKNVSKATIDAVPSLNDDIVLGQIMVATYKKLTQFGWPSVWATNPDESVPLTHFVDDAREIFCNQYKVLPDKDKDSALEPEVYEVIRKRIVFPLLASVGRPSKETKLSQTRAVSNSESRRDWDSLLFHLYVGGDEYMSHNIVLERHLQTCRNQNFDSSVEHRDGWDMRLYTHAWMHYTFCLSELSHAVGTMNRGAGIPGDKLFDVVSTPPHATQAYLRATWETNMALMKCELIKINIRPDDSKVDILVDLLKKRATKEPTMGICDAIAVEPVCLNDVDDEVLAKYRSFMEPQWNIHIKRKDEGQGLVIAFCAEEPSGPSPLASSTLPTTTPEASQSGHRTSETMDTPCPRDVWIPIMFSEHKRRRDDSPMKAVGQARSYICSGLNFMSSVGIRDHPVMSLVTNGTRGAVIMGWKSSRTDITYIMERSICIFDISVPIQAYHFAIFLIRLRLWAKEQRDELKKKIVKHFKDTPMDQLHKWTKEAQALQYFEIHNPDAFGKESGEPVPAATAK